MIARRAVLALPAVLGVAGLAGCRTDSLFAGPDPLGSRPPLAKDTEVLQYMIATESGLVSLYRSVTGARGGARHAALLSSLLAEHEQHLAQLRAWLVVPAGSAVATSAAGGTSAGSASSGGGSSRGPAAPAAGAGEGAVLSRLHVAEQQSSLAYLQYLGDMEPAAAQLFASIAASEFTHANALTQAGAR